MSEILKVARRSVKPSYAIRAWHRVQERVRSPRARRAIARVVALFRPGVHHVHDERDAQLLSSGFVLMPGFLSSERAKELRDLIAGYDCMDPWKPELGSFRHDSAPRGVHVADVPAAPCISALHEIAYDPRLLSLVSGYFGCRPYLDSIQVWWSLTGNMEPEEAENFHRDNDSIRFLKLFLYLTDVEETDGPHKFVIGSHRIGKLLARRRFSDAEVEGAFGADSVKTFTGVAGDAFIEDTWGIHKGQLPQKGKRLLAQIRYSIMPTVFRSPVLLEAVPEFDRRAVSSLLHV
jgi:hypothetical protein